MDRRGDAGDDPLADYRVIIEVPVAWGDMDAFAHVNNTVYFRWFESARIAWLDRVGFRGNGEEGAAGPILASTHCRFRRPLTYPDRVRVGARATSLSHDRFEMEYVVVSSSTGAVAAAGGGVVVAFDYGTGSKTNVPPGVREAIAEVDGVHPASE